MLQVRIHGRGGQGVVTAAEVLSVAAFVEGRHAQAFPSFGSERTGAPVVAFCRIADQPIRTREPVMAPDVLVVLDATLLHQVDLFAGLRPHGAVLINTSRSLDELGILELAREHSEERFVTVPATDIAVERIGRPVPNVVMLGGLAAFTGSISMDALGSAIRERFPSDLAERNVDAAREAFRFVAPGDSGVREVLGAAPD